MITINLVELLSILNFIILSGIVIFYFRKNYTIVEKETWDSAVEVCEEYAKITQENEELAGGEGIQVGFGADYLEDDDDDEEEEQEEGRKKARKREKKND